jgi:GNAT superfamily N-acetyltransferase
MTPATAVRIEALKPDAYGEAIPALGELIVDAVAAGSGVNFLYGVTVDEAAAWWEARIDQVESGVITAFVALDGERIVGSTILIRSVNPNSPHRAEVGKVIVLRSHRRRGIGAALMEAAESQARAEGRWLLILDTAAGSAADEMYRAMGWTAFGVVPNHAMLPDGSLSDTTYFWKDLR